MDDSADSSKKLGGPVKPRRPWVSTLKKIALCSGVAVICFGLYVLWFIHGEPEPTVDYLALLNEASRPKDLREEDNAWPLYQQAIELLVPPEGLHSVFTGPHRRFSELTSAEQTAVTTWVERNRDAWRRFLAASRKHAYYRPCCPVSSLDDRVDGLDVPSLNVDMTHLTPLRRLCTLAIWHCRIEVARGRLQNGIDDSLAMIRAGRHLSSTKLLMEMLLSQAFYSAGHNEILAIASTDTCDPWQVKELRRQLHNAFGADYPTLDLEGERIIFRDIVQHIFTKGGIGGGHLIPKYLPPLIRMHSVVITPRELDTEADRRQMAWCTAISMVHARRNETLREYLALADRAEEMAGMTPYQIRQGDISLGIERPDIFNYEVRFDSFLTQSRNFVVAAQMPAVHWMSVIVHRMRTQHDATGTVLALIAYRHDTGEYPDDLAVLVRGGYLEQLPQDPFSDSPLVYRETDGDFTLYSVGQNFTDEGGRTAYRGSEGRPMTWDRKADAVFWPLAH